MAKTEEERQKARKESKKRRAKQNRRAVLFIFILILVLILVIVLKSCSGKEKEKPEDSSEVSSNSETSIVSTTTDANGNYIQPAGADWNLILVNDWNAIDEAYVATIPFEDYNATWQFDGRALPQLNQMVEAANVAGCDIWGQSLYRDYETQKVLYWRQVDELLAQGKGQEEAETEAATIVKRPGTSEHNSGLAVDFECSEFQDLDEEFENTTAFAWLMDHCAEYGFILRFPKDKENITGVIYEPWHYRYVGVDAAKEIMSRKICLEEYLQEKGL